MRSAGYSLLNFLTSSHSHRCLRTEIPRYPYSWCLQETAVTVNVEIRWLPLSLGRRRLRFSFQFNDVKDRDWLSPAPLFSAGGRRRRLSSDRPLWCQSRFSACATIPRTLEFDRKNHPGLPRGFPPSSVAIRLRLGTILVSKRISSALSAPVVSFRLRPAPSGRRLSSGHPPGCQPIP